MTVIFLLCRARATDNVYVYTYVVKIGIFSCSLCAENSIEVAPAVIDLHVHMVAYREKKDVEQNKLDAAHTHTLEHSKANQKQLLVPFLCICMYTKSTSL